MIRTARQQDLVELTEVLTSSFHNPEGWTGWMYPLYRIGIYEDLRTRFRNKHQHYACLVAVHRIEAILKNNIAGAKFSHPANGSEVIAGTVEIGLRSPSIWQPLDRSYLYISNLAVQQNYRQQGAAFSLLQTCEQVAQQWGFHDLYLHVMEDNHAARRLYQKAGYHTKQVEPSLGFWLMGRPRQILMHRHF